MYCLFSQNMVQVEALTQNFRGGTNNTTSISASIAGLRAKIWNRELANVKEGRYPLDSEFRRVYTHDAQLHEN
jgi:hypothetical protein